MLERIYRKIRGILVPPSEHQLKVWEWKRSGKEKLRYEYDLNSDSIVLDLGGYEGEWTSRIFSMYSCTIYVFEPVKKYYEEIKARFSKNEHIKIFQFGLGDKDTEIEIGMNNDRSSIFNDKSTDKELITLKQASDFLTKKNIQSIDLMKINIEGGEFDLLEHLIQSGYIKICKNIQVQFHNFVPNATERIQSIRKMLEKTHKPTYQVDYVWENWERKNDGI